MFSSHLVVALCSVCCLILWSCLTLKGPFEDMHSHIMFGALVSLFLLRYKSFFAPSLCPFAPFTPITLCFVTFFWHFLHLLWCLLLIAVSPTLFFFPLCLSCSLLLAPYYFAIAHVLMVLTTHALCFILSWCSTWSFASIGICCLSFI